MVGGEAPFDFLGSGSHVRVTEEMLEDFFFFRNMYILSKRKQRYFSSIF